MSSVACVDASTDVGTVGVVVGALLVVGTILTPLPQFVGSFEGASEGNELGAYVGIRLGCGVGDTEGSGVGPGVGG